MMQRNIFDTDADYSKGAAADTSRQAFRRTSDETRSKQRRAVVAAIAESGGATCEEIAESMGIPYTSASGRISELAHRRIIRDTGQRRLTKYGRPARVYEVSQ